MNELSWNDLVDACVEQRRQLNNGKVPHSEYAATSVGWVLERLVHLGDLENLVTLHVGIEHILQEEIGGDDLGGMAVLTDPVVEYITCNACVAEVWPCPTIQLVVRRLRGWGSFSGMEFAFDRRTNIQGDSNE